MRYYLGLLSSSIFGLLALSAGSALAQTTNNVTVPNNAESTANPQVNLDQQGSLVNTQVNHRTLGRSVTGKGIADCTNNGLGISAYGSGVGPFDSGTIGGAITYTHSFGMETCKEYAKNQLGRAKLETCFLLISNFSKMRKAGIDVSYEALMEVANVDCPPVNIRQASLMPAVPSASATPPRLSNSPQQRPSLRPQAESVGEVQQPAVATKSVSEDLPFDSSQETSNDFQASGDPEAEDYGSKRLGAKELL